MNTIIVNRPHIYPPTCKCLICDKRQNPKAEIVDVGKAWLCEKCKAALLKVVERSENEHRNDD
jgi:hypothetical protein